MPLTSKIREQIISSFRAELAEHIQTLNDGLLALEQQKVSGKEREETLGNIFRAAHSLKGAARAVGVSAVEQLAHALEDVLGAMQRNTVEVRPALFTACYKAIDAIQATQAAYEAGETTPPAQALQALADLDIFRHKNEPAKPAADQMQAPHSGAADRRPAPEVKKEEPAAAQPEPKARPEPEKKSETGQKASSSKKGARKNDGRVDEPSAQLGQNENSKSKPSSAPEIDWEAAIPKEPKAEPETKEGPAAQAQPMIPAASEPPSQQAQPAAYTPTSDETIRVSVAKLDALMAQLSELLVTKIRAEQRLDQVRQAQAYMSLWQKEWLAERGAYSRLVRQDYGDGDGTALIRARKELQRLLEYVDSSQNRMRDMSALINNLSREYHSDTMQMSLVIDSLEEDIKRVRMLPLNTITGSFGRMVRDLAQASGKEAMLEILGGDVELDKRVLEQIKDPIIHLLRNAIDHGIETPARRGAIGKPAGGRITLSAEHQGKDVAISISDDGAGLNVDTIRQVATRRGIANANIMTDSELVELIYNPGFSTSPIITDVSGRGVGLDVVRRNVENLRGRISVDWKPGQGSRFTLFIPLALTSSRGLLVKASNQLFAIPLSAIERIMYVKLSDIETVGGHDTLRFEGRPLMLVHLSSVLNLPVPKTPENSDHIPVVILSAVERRMAFAVDELSDEQEVVIKGLGKQLSRVGGIAGASVMGNGEVLLILNVADLIKLAQRGEKRSILDNSGVDIAEPAPVERPKPRILVVDDSITTRTLEKNILEAAGYLVQLAMDGQEAYNIVTTGDLPDLIISDVSMPRLDGFGLSKRIKTDSRTSHLPLILVTSLDSAEDKARGIECGADAYIVKSSFDQNNLLETIEQLI